MKAASALATLALLAVAPQPTQAAFPGFTIVAAGLIGIIGRALGSAIQGARAAGTFNATALPPGVPQFEYERCRNDIKGRTIEINTNYQNRMYSHKLTHPFPQPFFFPFDGELKEIIRP